MPNYRIFSNFVLQAVGCLAKKPKKQRDNFFFFKTKKVLGLVAQAQIKCWLADQTERSSKKKKIGERNRENPAAIAQRLVKTSLRTKDVTLAANAWPLHEVADKAN